MESIVKLPEGEDFIGMVVYNGKLIVATNCALYIARGLTTEIVDKLDRIFPKGKHEKC